MSHFQGEMQEDGVSLGISVARRCGTGLPVFDVLGLFVVCQWCVGGGRKLWVRIDVTSLGWELSCSFFCLVNALQGHRGARAADFWFFWLLLELMFLSSSALSVCCQTSAFLPVLSCVLR